MRSGSATEVPPNFWTRRATTANAIGRAQPVPNRSPPQSNEPPRRFRGRGLGSRRHGPNAEPSSEGGRPEPGAGGRPVPTPAPVGASITGPTPCPAEDGSSPRVTGFAEAPARCIDPDSFYLATVTTTRGTI